MTHAQIMPTQAGTISAIVACDENNLIGCRTGLPWRIREDWKWFLNHTKGGACVIGRLSYEAMLNGGTVSNGQRKYFVVSADRSLAGPHTQVFGSTMEAVDAAVESGLPVWICGGVRIYEESFPQVDKLYITRIHNKYEGDRYMPDWKEWFGPVEYRRDSSENGIDYTFMILGRQHVADRASLAV